MRNQVVYVVTGDSASRALRYVEGLRLSVSTLRRFHPDIFITCFSDVQLTRELQTTGHPLPSLVDRWVECPDATGGPVCRSRWIKTTLRRRFSGPFLLLDADSLVVGPLDELFACQADLGITLDLYLEEWPGTFPAWLRPHYQRLGWPETLRYCASTTLKVQDNEKVHAFFDRWHSFWQCTVKAGLVVDQPALNHALEEVRPEIQVFPESFNLMVGHRDRTIPADARVLSLVTPLDGPLMSVYESLLERLANGEMILEPELASLTVVGSRLSRSYTPAPARWKSLMCAKIQRMAIKFGIYDISRT